MDETPNIRARLSKIWRVLLSMPLWVTAGLGALIVVLYLYVQLGPQVWNQVMIDTGDVRVTGGYISNCGRRYDVDVHQAQVKGAFPFACAGGADVLLSSENAQYWCPGAYMVADPTVYEYRIRNGKCETVGEHPRSGPRYKPPT